MLNLIDMMTLFQIILFVYFTSDHQFVYLYEEIEIFLILFE